MGDHSVMGVAMMKPRDVRCLRAGDIVRRRRSLSDATSATARVPESLAGLAITARNARARSTLAPTTSTQTTTSVEGVSTASLTWADELHNVRASRAPQYVPPNGLRRMFYACSAPRRLRVDEDSAARARTPPRACQIKWMALHGGLRARGLTAVKP